MSAANKSLVERCVSWSVIAGTYITLGAIFIFFGLEACLWFGLGALSASLLGLYEAGSRAALNEGTGQ